MDFFKNCISEVRVIFKRDFRTLSRKIRIIKKIHFMQILVDGPKKKLTGKFVFDHRCTIYLAHKESIYKIIGKNIALL